MPVMEEVQMGLTIGLTLDGYIPVSCFLDLIFNTCTNN